MFRFNDLVFEAQKTVPVKIEHVPTQRSKLPRQEFLNMKEVKEQIKLEKVKEKLIKNPPKMKIDIDKKTLNKSVALDTLKQKFNKAKDKSKYIQKNKNHIKNLSKEEQIEMIEFMRGNFM